MRRKDDGYSLVMLMAAITLMLIAMAVAAPSWQHVMQDDREQELLFRGCQIADGILAYQKKNGNAFPISLEVLVKGRFLRKAYKDPMVKDGKWKLIRQGDPTGLVGTRPPGVGGPGAGSGSPSPSPSPAPGSTMGPGSTGQGLGGFIGVASFNKQKSLRVLNNARSYDTWRFIAGQPCVVGKTPTIGAGPGPGIPNPSPRPGASPVALPTPQPMSP
jgi:type II secretory pathway pseudopilin PulG